MTPILALMSFVTRRRQDRHSVTTHRRILPFPAARRLTICTSLVFTALAQNAAFAQARLEAQYEATLAGIPVGRGSWTIEIGDDQYTASAFGGTTGLFKALSNGSGTGASQGRVVNGALIATNYSASTTTSKKTEAIHIVLTNGNVK